MRYVAQIRPEAEGISRAKRCRGWRALRVGIRSGKDGDVFAIHFQGSAFEEFRTRFDGVFSVFQEKERGVNENAGEA